MPYTFGPKEDPECFQLYSNLRLLRNGKHVSLGGAALTILTALVAARSISPGEGGVLSNEVLLGKLRQNRNEYGGDTAVKDHMVDLRAALEPNKPYTAITNLRGVGYWFAWNVKKSDESTPPTIAENTPPSEQLPALHEELTSYRQILIAHYGPIKLSPLQPAASPGILPGTISMRDVFIAAAAKAGATLESDADTEISNEAPEENNADYPLPSTRPVEDILASHKRIVIVAGPGLGKSFLLEKLALDWAEGLSSAIPFLIDLTKFEEDRSRPRNFVEYLETGTTLLFNVPRGAAERLLQESETVVMFDGLDRIFPEGARSKIADEIVNFANRYQSSRLVTTTRPEGYATEPQILENLQAADFHNFTLQEFDREQMGEYIQRWYAATKPGKESEQKELSLRLQKELDGSKSLRTLASNPLILTLILLLSPAKRLRLDRVGLYTRCAEILAKSWNVPLLLLPHTSVQTDVKLSLLQRVAFEMRREHNDFGRIVIGEARLTAIWESALAERNIDKAGMVATTTIKDLGARHPVLRRVGADQYAFVHQTFLDYFAAREFSDLLKDAGKQHDIITLFREKCRDEAWRDLLRFVCVMIPPALAMRMIRDFLAARTDPNEWAPVFVAADCLREIPGTVITERDRVETHDALRQLSGFDFPYKPQLGDPEREIIVQVRQGAIERLARGWPDDSTRTWLMETAGTHEDFKVRRAAVTEIARGWPIQSTRDWLYGLAGRAEPTAAVREMARGWRDGSTYEWLQTLLSDSPDASVRIASLHELTCKWRQDSTRPWLLNLLRKSPDALIRRAALHELARGWHDARARDLLLECASDPEINIRAAAVWDLGDPKWKGEEVRQLLEQRADDNQVSVRRHALRGLARVWRTEDTLAWLLSRSTEHIDAAERAAAMREIGERWREDNVMEFLARRAISESDGYARAEALTQLAKYGAHGPTCQILEVALRATDWQVRSAAVRGLPRVRPDDVTRESIIAASGDEVDTVRRFAIEELVRNWRDDLVQDVLLERAKHDVSHQVRERSVRGLGRGWRNDRTRILLLDIVFDDKSSLVRLAAEVTLGRAWPGHPEVETALTRLRLERNLNLPVAPSQGHLSK
jgi:DNA-binding winged helix-turn-helix (wHTH) protein